MKFIALIFCLFSLNLFATPGWWADSLIDGGQHPDPVFTKKSDCEAHYHIPSATSSKCLELPFRYDNEYHYKSGDTISLDSASKTAVDLREAQDLAFENQVAKNISCGKMAEFKMMKINFSKGLNYTQKKQLAADTQECTNLSAVGSDAARQCFDDLQTSALLTQSDKDAILAEYDKCQL